MTHVNGKPLSNSKKSSARNRRPSQLTKKPDNRDLIPPGLMKYNDKDLKRLSVLTSGNAAAQIKKQKSKNKLNKTNKSKTKEKVKEKSFDINRDLPTIKMKNLKDDLVSNRSMQESRLS